MDIESLKLIEIKNKKIKKPKLKLNEDSFQ